MRFGQNNQLNIESSLINDLDSKTSGQSESRIRMEAFNISSEW